MAFLRDSEHVDSISKKKLPIFLPKPCTILVVLLYKHENLSRVTSEIHIDGANKGLICNIVQIHCFWPVCASSVHFLSVRVGESRA